MQVYLNRPDAVVIAGRNLAGRAKRILSAARLTVDAVLTAFRDKANVLSPWTQLKASNLFRGLRSKMQVQAAYSTGCRTTTEPQRTGYDSASDGIR